MPPWITSLLREEMPVPMFPAASATITSWPLHAAPRATASPTTPAPITRTCIGRPSSPFVINDMELPLIRQFHKNRSKSLQTLGLDQGPRLGKFNSNLPNKAEKTMRKTVLRVAAVTLGAVLAGPALAASCQNTGSYEAWLSQFKKDATAPGRSAQ